MIFVPVMPMTFQLGGGDIKLGIGYYHDTSPLEALRFSHVVRSDAMKISNCAPAATALITHLTIVPSLSSPAL